ncbi:MAG: hypothetical protein LBE33_03590 [Zoogloeaceae bacterium]|jgi:hypothetical protein|nr:hypothetical protein [Zoogloeaceae bacterium]
MRIIKSSSFLLMLALGLVNSAFAGEDTHSGQAAKHSGAASANASGSAAHSIAASGQATSAVMAVPLSVGGVALSTAGAVSIGVAGGSMKAATASAGKPLEITDETITVIPPNEALKTKN